MAVFANGAANKSQPLNLDYVDSATMANRMCGPAFVNATISNAGASSGGGGKVLLGPELGVSMLRARAGWGC